MACSTANPAAGVTRSSQPAAPGGRTLSGLAKKYGTTITATTTATGPAPCRKIVPRASARTAATASSAAVPAIRRASVSALTGSTNLPLARSSRPPTASAAAAPASPATKVTEPTTIAFAARTRPRSGLAASVTRIRPRRYSAVTNMEPTTAITISAANTPARLCPGDT